MIAYAVLMWAIAALFLLLGLLIYHGKTGLIHEYHRERVRSEDMAAYGRAFSTGLFALAGTLVLSGIVSLLWTLPGRSPLRWWCCSSVLRRRSPFFGASSAAITAVCFDCQQKGFIRLMKRRHHETQGGKSGYCKAKSVSRAHHPTDRGSSPYAALYRHYGIHVVLVFQGYTCASG